MNKPAVKKFSKFLLEGSSTEEQKVNFSRNVLEALDELNISYIDISSSREKQNGTVVIRINDPKLVRDELERCSIEPSDFENVSADKTLNWFVDHVSNIDNAYKFYVRGAVRREGASADMVKFDIDPDGIKEAVEQMIDRWKKLVINNSLYYLDEKKFRVRKKTPCVNLEKLKKYLTDGAIDLLKEMIKEDEYLLNYLSLDLARLSYVAHRKGERVFTPEKMHFAVDNPDLSFGVSSVWKHLHKEGKIENRLTTKHWAGNYRGMPRWRDVINNNSVYLTIFENEGPELLKLNFEHIDNKYRGSLGGEKFDI